MVRLGLRPGVEIMIKERENDDVLKPVEYRLSLKRRFCIRTDGGGKFMKGIGFVRKSEEGAGVDEDLHLAFFFHP